jgi:PAS domain S-box-containing protein
VVIAGLTAPIVALIAAGIAGVAAAGLIYLFSVQRARAPTPENPHGTDAAKLEDYQLILDTLERSNVLIWWARVTREGLGYKWKIRTPPQLSENLIFRLASLVKQDWLWKDEQSPDHERMNQTSAKALSEGASGYQQEFPIIGLDGMHWLSEEVTIRPAGQNEWNLVGVIVDSTKRHEVEAQYRVIVENARDGILMTTPDGNVVFANPAMARIFGYESAEGFMREVPSMTNRYADDAKRAEIQRRLEESGGVEDCEVQMHRKDGTLIWIVLNIQVVLDKQGGRQYEGTFEDVTKRKLVDAQIREQNDILSQSHEGVMIVSLANEVSLWNRGAEEIFGWTAAEALGRSPEKLLGAEGTEAFSSLRAAVERDGFWNGEMRLKTREGRSLIVHNRATLVRDEAGRPRARLNFLADITEKKLLEEKFLHAQRIETIGMLAAGIAHDLNNVLAPIMFAAPLLRDSLSTPRDLKILETLKQCAARGAGLVKQILGFVHSTTGEFQLTHVRHIARDVISVIEETFPRSIELEQKVPSDLWPVLGNVTQIHQVLLNLCVNARDAMPRGGTLGITAANRRLNAAEADAIPKSRPGAWLVLEVSDTGTGIPPEVLERIWTPFFTTKGVDKGTGLGLSTVRGIVANHQGFIELNTEVGRGTTFRVFLPAVESESPDALTASPFEIPDGQGELILLVDDDAPIREIGTAILEHHGYRVVSCVDGVDAIILFVARAAEISLVITDVEMPRLGGTELAYALSQIRPNIPLLAISGLPPDETGDSGASEAKKLTRAFLAKPFSAADLLGTVHRLIHPSGKR